MSPGVARCEPCSRRHRESSGAFRGIPLWDPNCTVIGIATGREHGPYDSEADVALRLAFVKLSRSDVKVAAIGLTDVGDRRQPGPSDVPANVVDRAHETAAIPSPRI